jgi:hypothetical protein
MHKKDVPSANQFTLSYGEEPLLTSSDFDVNAVSTLIHGEPNITIYPSANIGLSSGLPRVILSGGYANSPNIVLPPLSKLRITGLSRLLRNRLTTRWSSTWSVTPPIFIRMGVC